MELRSDRQLVESYQGGDTQALEALLRRHRPAARTIAARLLRDHDDAEDATQQALLKAHAQLAELRDPDRFGPWLKAIVRSTCTDQLRAQHAQTVIPVGTGVEALRSRRRDGPADRVLDDEAREQVAAALQLLSDDQRAALEMYHFENRPYAAISRILDRPLNTTRSLLHRGRARMLRALSGYVLGDGLCRTVRLESSTLPSRQGWQFCSGFEFLFHPVDESRVWKADGRVLRLDNADLFPDNVACYVLPGVVDPEAPFCLHLRARVLRQTARYPEFRVEDAPRGPNGGFRDTAFRVAVRTGIESFTLSLGRCVRTLAGGHEVYLDMGSFHDYRLEGVPGAGCRVTIDGTLRVVGLGLLQSRGNGLVIGDESPQGGNTHTEISHFSFTQSGGSAQVGDRPGRRASNELFDSLRGPVLTGRAAHLSAQRMRAALRVSRRWRLSAGEPIAPRDFARA